MLKKILLPTIFVILAIGFWTSPDFKEIAAGVAIFLFGMLSLEEGFRAFTGGLLEKILAKTTNTLGRAISFGIASTTIMQSSSLVSIITISFLSAGLIGLSAGIGIIFGANIGTTTGAWLVAGFGLKVKISAYAMPMLVFGIIMVFQNNKTIKGIGYVLTGLGFLFLGIHHMKSGFENFKDTIDLAQYAMPGFFGLLVFMLIGTFATVVMQSSHATLVLIITALAAGQITYENGLALAIGANVGTTITAIIGSLSANYQGKRLALAHLIFNVVTGLIAVVFIQQIMWAVDIVSANVGIGERDFTLKLAVFHTIFNSIGVIVMTPLTGKLVVFLEKTIPAPHVNMVEPKFLNDAAIEFPETVFESLRNETMHLYDNAFEVMAHGLNVHRRDIQSEIDLEEKLQNSKEVMNFDLDQVYMVKVKALYAAILDFISRAQPNIPLEQAGELARLRDASRFVVQSIKGIKHLKKNIDTYIVTDHDIIREQYNDIRIQLAEVMRTIHILQTGEDDTIDVLDLDDFKVEAEENNIIVNGELDEMMRNGSITAVEGVSLMNDLGYARNVVWNLTELGKTLYEDTDDSIKTAQELLALDDEDVVKIATEEAIDEKKMSKSK
ncbi:MAG: Na/Pi symporter [Alphaproteobacteria bacterium]|nr:Na/Pi symporter [Rhodospirillales bacterium]MCW9044780.1 Na/Pi symporter [Alphaproteobacteria bacterium]